MDPKINETEQGKKTKKCFDEVWGASLGHLYQVG